MSTENYVTIEKQISEEAKADYNYRHLHSMMTIKDKITGEKLVVPYASLSATYMDYLKDYIEEKELTDAQWIAFKHNPQAMSEAIYGTTKYWAMLLEINHCKSRIEFTKRKVKYYNPDKLLEIVNEVLMKENW